MRVMVKDDSWLVMDPVLYTTILHYFTILEMSSMDHRVLHAFKALSADLINYRDEINKLINNAVGQARRAMELANRALKRVRGEGS